MVDDASPGDLDRCSDARRVMGAEVVHHHHVALAKNGNEVVVDEATKHGCVRASDVRHHRLDAVQRDGADHRQDGASVSRQGVVESLSAARAAVRASHADVRTRLVEKNESSSIDRFQLGDEFGAPRLDRGTLALGGDQALFFRVKPSFLAARYTYMGPTVTLERFENTLASSTSVASG